MKRISFSSIAVLIISMFVMPAVLLAGQTKGKIQFVTNGFKMMQVENLKTKEIEIFQISKGTKFVHAKSLRSFIPNDMVHVTFGKGKNVMQALTITKIPREGGISAAEFKKYKKTGNLIVDVRSPKDKRLKKFGMIPKAVNIPLNKLEASLGKIPKNKPAVVYCNTGVIATFAYQILKKNGYKKVSFVNAPFPEIK